jgi:hypothetical protein
MVIRILKYIASTIVVLSLLFVFVANFSSVESRYECKGELTFMGVKQPKTLYMRIGEYRWWVGLWSDSDGDVHIEIPNEIVRYYFDVNEVGDQLQIFGANMKLVGSFSKLSKSLSIDSGIGIFDGKCERISNKN